MQEPTPAGNGTRLVAHLIDSFAWVVAIALAPPSVGLLVLVAWIGLWVVVAAGGMSPGKRAMGLVCVDLGTGRPATLAKMVVRDLLAKTLLSTVTFGVTGLIGSIQILGNDRRRALWDSMSDTVVVHRSTLGATSGASAPPVSPPSPTSVAPTMPAVPTLGEDRHAEPPLATEALVESYDPSGLEDRTVVRRASDPAAATSPAIDVIQAAVWSLQPSWDVDRSLTGENTVLVGRNPRPAEAGTQVMMTPAAESAVSRTQCAVHLGDELRVEDLGSRNGTIVERPDGVSVALLPHEPAVLPDGSRIVLGDHSLVVRRR